MFSFIFPFFYSTLFLFSSSALAQFSAGTQKTNDLLSLPITINGAKESTFVTLDSNWRWIHNKEGYANCFDGSGWVSTFCPDPVSCAKNCQIEGVPNSEWKNPYGVSVSGNAARLNFVTKGQYGDNIGSRLYLVATDKKNYRTFNLLNKEFTFTVDVSNIPCGINGALYFVEMPAVSKDSGISSAYGINYGDAQCPSDIKYINGWANTNGSGACSHEMDIWEANSESTAFTPHTCSKSGVAVCTDSKTCGTGGNRYNGWCDKDGADYNPYRHGDTTFYGKGSSFKVDTSKPFQVITQFITNSAGDLASIKRYYVQGNSGRIFGGELTDESIAENKKKFNENNHFKTLGGMKGMGKSLARGHVLALSLWDDSSAAQMRWLDSTYPVGSTAAGAARGRCPTTGSDPSTLRSKYPNSYVVYSDIQLNDIKSAAPSPSPSPSPSPPSPAPAPSPTPSGSYWKCDTCTFIK